MKEREREGEREGERALGSTRSVMVTVVTNGYGELSSKPG